MKKIKVIAIESTTMRGRWHFATPGIFRPGLWNKSCRTWASKQGALRAGRREYKNVYVKE